MCGRFVLLTDLSQITESFNIQKVASEYRPGNNLSPGNRIVAVIREEDQNILVDFCWGLIPSWAKDPLIGKKMFNARAETVSEKPSFRNAFRNRRCLIVADGFYEWQKQGTRKRPYHIRVKDQEYFAMAGIYDTWSKEGEDLVTFSILTTAANEALSPIHDRMPVILRQDREAEWASKEVLSADALSEIFQPLPASSIDAYPVSDMVNDSRADHPDMVVPQRMQQATLF